MTGRRRRSGAALTRRAVLLVAIAIALVVLGAVAGAPPAQAEPPRVFIELSVADAPLAHPSVDPISEHVTGEPATVMMGEPIDLFVSVDVPALVRVAYGETEIEAVAQDLRVSLLPESGLRPLRVEAEDAAGRVTSFETRIIAAWPPQPRLETVSSVTVGDALTLRLRWDVEAERAPQLGVIDAAIELEGERLGALQRGDELMVLVPMPLESAPGSRAVRGWVRDERGVAHEVLAEVVVRANPNPVQELNVATSTLAVVTPEGRALEATTLEAAFAAVGPEPRWSAPFVLPLEGRATSAFGLPRRYAPGGPVSFHVGTDIAAPTGTPIVATNDGIVTVAGMYPIKGGLVIIDHGFGVSSLYFHQSRLHVAVGDVVQRGEVIGEVGSTGLSTGPHLHWEMRIDGVPTAPLAWVDRYWPGEPLDLAVGGE